MNFELNLWELIMAFGSAVVSAFAYVRVTTNSLWEALNKHKEDDNKVHLDIVQNVVPNAIRDVCQRMDARFDRLEDKIDNRKSK